MKEVGPMKYERIVLLLNEPIFRKKTFLLDIDNNVMLILTLVFILIFSFSIKLF